MNKLQKGLAGLVLSGLMAVSGCGIKGIVIGGSEPVNLSKSYYAPDIEKKADELADSNDIKDKMSVLEAYGSIGLLEKMDETVREIINKDLEAGMDYAKIGDKYHKKHKK